MTKPHNSAENMGKTTNIDGFEPARAAILGAALKIAVFDGWSSSMLRDASKAAGISKETQIAALPGGIKDVLRYWSEKSDAEMRGAMATPEFAALKTREKVAFAVRARLDLLRPDKEAARRAAAFLALPHNSALGGRLAWKTSDAIWRGLGDKSTDFNFYSKRGILTGVWTSTFTRWLGDESVDEAATNAFLDARIDNVMQIEKVKAKVRASGFDPKKPIEFLARLRYPMAGR